MTDHEFLEHIELIITNAMHGRDNEGNMVDFEEHWWAVRAAAEKICQMQASELQDYYNC